MTYPTHYLLSWGGTLCSGGEIWSNNLRLTNPQGAILPDVSDYGERLDDVEAALRTLAGKSEARWMSTTKCTWIKFNKIGPNGHYLDEENSHTKFVESNPIGGGVGGPWMPPQCAVVLTLHTAAERGRASRGRIFIPQPGVSVNPDGHFDATQAQGMATAYAQLISDINDGPGLTVADLNVSVVSGVGDAVHHQVTRVSVGDVVDTQRRRRSALKEARKTASVDT